MNQLPEAAAELREAIRLQPDFLGAHTNLATVLQALGDADGASAERKLVAELSRKGTNLQGATFSTNSGIRLLNAGDVDTAIAQFQQAIKLTPDYAPAYYQLGRALQRLGKTAEAEQAFVKAASLDPRYRR
jgi:tetratricopeptide (TPR) repeat protein